jgi:hypothetical protein
MMAPIASLPHRGVELIQTGEVPWHIRQDARAGRFGDDAVPIEGVSEDSTNDVAIPSNESSRHYRPQRAVKFVRNFGCDGALTGSAAEVHVHFGLARKLSTVHAAFALVVSSDAKELQI